MKYARFIAVAAAATLALSACSGASDDPTPAPTVSSAANGADAAALADITWTDGADQPALEFDQPLTVTGTAGRLVADGDGEAIAAGSILEVDYVVFNGADGEIMYSTYTTGQTEQITLQSGTVDPALFDVLEGSSVGADVIYATLDPSTEPATTLLMALTVRDATTVLARAEGEAVEPADGLPTVTLDDTGKPTVDVAGAAEPDELVAQTLIEGDGEPLELGQQATVHYTGWLWDGEQFDSSWDRGNPSTFSFVEGGLIEGWTQGLAGVPVGSQVLLVIPSDLGYGDAGTETIPGGATLVFVVDILAAA